ncbi:hypothetical protein CPB86DRAFT_758078 [Serendipita vermifera]|nr:hypothetical protein CPB86DRAFT_758078 [Serendipita vermifera]
MADSSKLVEALYTVSARQPKLIKSSEYIAPEDSSILVTSWKMNEFKYYDVPSPFPTLARGLFTADAESKERGVKYRIVARGYDKFFNIGEVPWTNWRAIERHTVAPYTMTLKSNGCIIFIAALTPTKLLVTSKHSIGAVDGAEESHAQVGERWLNWHLQEAGKTREQLSAYLWEKNWTAVAELCDDSFEEHVLPTSQAMTGLNLHGLNLNNGEFHTQEQPIVDAFAEEWGFIKTPSIVLDTVEEVQKFAEDVGKTGKWNGEAVEGFVVRTTIGPRPDGVFGDTPPYPPGSSFFFKIKFDEPYMMYRDWRELTKALLAAKAKGKMADAKISKAKLRRKETVVYKQWVEKEIVRNPKLFSSYTHNRGIVAVRDAFFKYLESPDGRANTSALEEITNKLQGLDIGTKVVLVPIAVPGCGKTTISVALTHLFKFGHTQNDDLKGKRSPNVFQQNIRDLFETHDVVIADRNNHTENHRKGIREAVSSVRPRPRLIALNWPISEKPQATVHRIVTDRIRNRGENHQTLPASAQMEDVVWKFIGEFEELGEEEVDDVIEMDVNDGLEEALDRAVRGVVDLLGLSPPSDEEMGKALRAARDYAPSSKANNNKKSGKKAKEKPIRYYGILPEIDLEEVIGSLMATHPEIPDSARELWEHMKSNKRVTGRPHITIVHMKELERERPIWKACEELMEARPPLFEFKFDHLVWNDRVMALTVEDITFNAEDGAAEAASKFLGALGDGVKRRLHVTVGTKDPSIPPVEAKELVEEYRSGAQISTAALDYGVVRGRVKGLIG